MYQDNQEGREMWRKVLFGMMDALWSGTALGVLGHLGCMD